MDVVVTFNNASVGIVYRTTDGIALTGTTFKLGKCSLLVAEMVAIQEGIVKVAQMGFSHVELRSDSLLYIRILLGQFRVPWYLSPLVFDILNCKFCSIELGFVHILSQKNNVAKFLSRLSLESSVCCSKIWQTNRPLPFNKYCTLIFLV